MSDNKLYKIDFPNEEPTNILDYKKQNYLLQKIPLFSLGFDGIKLANWNENNIEIPYIIAGSIIEFDGNIYEARNDIIFIDECNSTLLDRYIVFYKNNEDDYLQVKIANNNFPAYIAAMRGFYNLSNNIVTEKYLRVSMKKENTGYRSKNYWDKDNINRVGNSGDDGGGALKKYSMLYKIPGTFTFEYPMNAESVIFHIMAAGGGGGGYKWTSTTATAGGESKIMISGNNITICGGGTPGGDAAGTGWVGTVGIGGLATGRGTLYNGDSASGRNGGSSKSSTNAIGGNGGDGAGACAIVEILRSELGSNNTVIIVVGAKGNASPHGNNQQIIQTPGENGSIYLEYYA